MARFQVTFYNDRMMFVLNAFVTARHRCLEHVQSKQSSTRTYNKHQETLLFLKIMYCKQKQLNNL